MQTAVVAVVMTAGIAATQTVIVVVVAVAAPSASAAPIPKASCWCASIFQPVAASAVQLLPLWRPSSIVGLAAPMQRMACTWRGGALSCSREVLRRKRLPEAAGVVNFFYGLLSGS